MAEGIPCIPNFLTFCPSDISVLYRKIDWGESFCMKETYRAGCCFVVSLMRMCYQRDGKQAVLA